ncbi:MAG: translocation and assembly module TamB [Rhodoferax sp.]
MTKIIRFTLGLLVATLLLVLALAGGLWIWSGTGSSLATALNQAVRYLPGDQRLEVREVAGALRDGGRIGWLRWQQGGLSVEAQELSVTWTLKALLQGELQLGQLNIKQLRIEDRRPAQAPSTPAPPASLALPLRLSLPFAVNTLTWVGNTELHITHLNGQYTFNSQAHELDLDGVQFAAGTYDLKARLQAQAPMALSAQLQGAVQSTLPASASPMTVNAKAELQGQLAGTVATLQLQAQLLPAFGKATANITAQLQPWQPQPVLNASASWQALDLAALWPQAPQTQLYGKANVTPEGTGWRAGLQLSNRQSGPWDQHRLPLKDLTAKVFFADSRWTLETLQAQGGGGRLEALGQFTDAPRWQGSAKLFGINPAALDSRLAANRLSGQLSAQPTADGIAFEARLKTNARPSAAVKTSASSAINIAGLLLKNLQVSGLWQAPRLALNTLSIATEEAQLQGNIAFDTLSQVAEGKLQLTLPGAQASLAGHMASNRGHGEFNLRVTEAAQVSRWLARLPGAPAALRETLVQGGAELSGQWQGGWQNQDQALQLQARLRAPELDLRQAAAPTQSTLRLRDLQADVTGSLHALRLAAGGQAEMDGHRLTLQTQVQGGQTSDGNWQASLETLQLSVLDRLRPGTWALQLENPVALRWQPDSGAPTLNVAAGSLRLSGPVPGNATVNWQAARWSQRMTGSKTSPARTEWQTQGSLHGLPLAWLDSLGQSQLDNLGLRGDLLFGGQWDASSSDTLRLRATLARTGGDLQLLTPADDLATPSPVAAAAGSNTSSLRAGVREARLVITVDGEQLAANLRWDSERAGQAQVMVSTQLQRSASNWSLPANAPLAGTLRMTLPPVGAWSLLAPPGWRLRGTLDADAMLSGTLKEPQWQGTLRAQDLAVQSVVDGIDFSNGTLNARLNGQRLDIVDFTLQGAGGRDGGGQFALKGSVLWLPATASTTTVASRLRIQLEATAKTLRVSARADRRLVLSGTLSAELKEARLTIRGQLQADQALFILPEDSTPQLGSDVYVRTTTSGPTTAPQPTATGGTRITPNVLIMLDLGPRFQIRGRGIRTRLAGQLTLSSNTGTQGTPRLVGEVRTLRGSYQAYGQQLDIEEGVLRFTGPIDNPSLDILAIRPNLQQRVGVQISGTALSPLVRLYAEPDLPDAEKLSWLVLGRSAANGGAEAAVLQQAALALLGGSGGGISGNLAAALGLDQVSMRGGTSNADGSTTAGATVVLGKRLSRDFYVSYERSLAGTLGTFYIFYDLSRRFTLRGQTGEQSAIDLIFTFRYD